MSADLQQLDLRLLQQLLSSPGQTIDAGSALGLSRTQLGQLNAAIGRLKTHGCQIIHDLRGTRLIQTGLSVWSDYLKFALSDSPVRSTEVYQCTTSTQDLAKARADRPLLIFADVQTGGRGRLGRSWHAPAGTGLLFSMTHQSASDRSGSIDRTSFLTAVAVAQAVEQLTGRGPIQISWPNDLVIDQHKLAGILVEAVRKGGGSATLVIGVGINVTLNREHLADMPEDVRARATSFRMQGWAHDRLAVAEHVIRRIDHCLAARDIQPLVEAWRTRNLYRDQTIRLRADGRVIEGTVLDLDPDTGLILRRDTGEIIHLHAATTTVEN